MPTPRLLSCRSAALTAALLASLGSAQKKPDVRIDHMPAGKNATRPTIAASGTDVYVAWEDDRNGLRDVYFNRSADGGGTWLPSDVRLNTTTGPLGSGYPDSAASGASAYVVYGGDGGVRCNRSLDRGATWLAQDVLVGSALSGYPVVTAAGANVFVVYREITLPTLNNDLYFRRSLDSGASWQPAIRLDTDAVGGGDSVDQRIAISGNAVFVAWRDKRPGPGYDVYFNRSLDGGATWLPTDVRMNIGIPAGSADAFWNAELAVSGSTVYVLWWDNRNAPGKTLRDVFVMRSLDSGTTWPSTPTRLDTDAPGAYESHFPHIAASGSSAWVVWSEFRNGPPDIYMTRTSDNGTTWLAADVRIDNAPSGTTSGVTQIAARGNEVYVAFQDDRFGGACTFFNRSVDGGATWLPVDQQLQTQAGAVPLSFHDIASSDSGVYVAWEDSRGPTRQIYFTIPCGFQPYGTSQLGSGGIAPSIAGTGHPSLGLTVSLEVSKGLGGAAGVLLVGGPGSRTAIPILGGTAYVLWQLEIPFVLGGSVGLPGTGTYTLPVPIANSTFLLGWDLYIQPVVLDPGAAFGLAIGHALEMWIG